MSRRDRALEAFAGVMLPGDTNEKGEPCYPGEPAGDHVWLYAGRHEEGQEPPHLSIDDFRAARRALGLPAVKVFPGARGVTRRD